MNKSDKVAARSDMNTLKVTGKVPEVLGLPEMDPFYRIPAEIWEILLLEHVKPGRNLYAAYNSWSKWKSILERNKTGWMFTQIFPFLFKHLSKTDILTLRLVNKRWCHGVDHFLENNPVLRPTWGEDEFEISNNIDLLHSSLLPQVYYKKVPIFYHLSLDRKEQILEQAKNHPRNPFVGRFIQIAYHPSPQFFDLTKPNLARSIRIGTKVLEQFGPYIHFLELHLYNYHSVDWLHGFIKLFTSNDLTNLKRLNIMDYFGVDPQFPDPHDLNNQLQLCLDKLTAEEKSHFPKNLETLTFNCKRSGVLGMKLRQIIITIFSENLKNFSNFCDIFTFPENIHYAHLCDLTLDLLPDESLKSFSVLVAPIRRLTIHIYKMDNETATRFIQAINRFGATLRFLSMGSFIENDCCAKGVKPFSIRNGLDLPNLKTFQFCGRLPSFNFITGLVSLEYLHLRLRIKRNPCVFPRETLDIRRHLRNLNLEIRCSLKRPQMYESNIWRVYRRLKIFTLEVMDFEGRSQKKWAYRRSCL